jgi:peroxiredoxin Q/BCP
MMLAVGSKAPEFRALNHHGQHVTLSSLRGRPVLLWFYPKADTPG